MPPYRRNIDFRWYPNNTVNMDAIARMRENFPKPKGLPPIAWFMGEINYYEEVVVNEWNYMELDRYLRDTGSGIRIFGRFKIWVEWFLYLLPDLILKCAKEEDSNLYETVISYCFSVYQYEWFDEHFLFYPDIFETLMQVMMQSRFWKDDDIFAVYWTDPIEELRPETNGRALNATMMFCIKYLTPQDIPLWVKSIADISGEQWQNKIRSWLLHFKKMLKYIENPELYHTNVLHPISLSSHIDFNKLSWANFTICFLKEDTLEDFLPQKHITAFLSAIEKYPHLNTL